jgi:hypothetical protein
VFIICNSNNKEKDNCIVTYISTPQYYWLSKKQILHCYVASRHIILLGNTLI